MRPLVALSFALLSLSMMVGCSKKDEPVVKAPVLISVAPETKKAPDAQDAQDSASKGYRPARPVDLAAENEIDPAEFAHVLHYDGRSFVVLASPSSIDDAWTVGDPSLVSLEWPVVTRKDVDTAKLPSKILHQSGLSVQLAKGNKAVCRGKLGTFSMLSRVEPHYGVRLGWAGEDTDAESKPPTHEEIAQEAWDLADGGRLLVAELSEVVGDCKTAEYVRSSALSLPQVVSPQAPQKALREAALAAFRDLEDYQTIASSFAELALEKPSPSWDTYDGAEPKIVSFASAQGSYVWVSAYAGTVCSEFEGKLEALFQVEASPSKQKSLHLLYVGTSELAPQSLLLSGPKASPTLVGFDSTLAPRRDGAYRVHRLDVPFLDCPC